MDEARTTGKRVRRLLFATDGSAASRAALLAVAGLAMGGETEVLVLHVTHHCRAEDSRALVTGIVEGLIALAINARPELRHAAHGHVAREIAAAAVQYGADLVVLGSRGRSDLGGLLLGSVGHEVLERVACPVLMVRAGRRPGVRPRRVLLAVAGDEDIAELVGITAAIAELEARVLVLHLLAHGDGDLQFAASAHLVDHILARLRKCGIHARGRVRATSRGAAGEIAKTALSYGADLIVMGSRRLPELTALLRGSVSHRVVNLSDRPVLVAARAPRRVSGAPGGVRSKEPAPPT